MPFSQKNPFNADANFTSIKFGVNKPVLEVELNEMQSILRNHSKDSIKELFGDGVVGKGQYTYTSNKFTLANEVVVLDGEVIKVDSVSVTANNGDTIYLHSWIELKSFEDTIKKYGNSASATTVTNTIKDARVNMETSRREQLLFNVATTLDGSKNSLKLGRIVNNTFVLDCNVLNQNNFELVQQDSYITVDNTKDGAITDIEVLGNTIQNSSNLADIKSVGVAREDGNYEIELKSCGNNLLDPSLFINPDSYNICYINTRVLGGTTYRFSHKESLSSALCEVQEYNIKNEITVAWKGIWHGTSITTNINTSYIKIKINQVHKGNIMLIKGTSISYEPYQGTTSKIIIPCQLEKVGTISDRLFRREDGVWCIEKNIETLVLNGSENWSMSTVTTKPNTQHFSLIMSKMKILSSIICNKFNSIPHSIALGTHDEECLRSDTTNNALWINILKSKLSTQDVAGFKTWLEQNNLLVKYVLNTPQIFELPLDVQISLNSFFGTTNVFIESGEVDGTIKCTIPKSLGGSIQSINSKADSLQQRVEKIENLQKGNEMIVATNKKSVVVEDTNEGYVTDFNIKGDTLVNLLGKITSCSSTGVSYLDSGEITFNQTVATTGANPRATFGNSLMEANKTYTLIFNITKNTLVNTNSTPNVAKFNITSYNTGNYIIPQGATGLQIVVLKQPSVTTGKAYVEMVNACVGELVIKDYMVLEGDHTDKDISYFEGLKSVGDGTEKIELYSCGKNLFNEELEVGSFTTNSIDVGKTYDQVLMDSTTRLRFKKIFKVHDVCTIKAYSKIGKDVQIGIQQFKDDKVSVLGSTWISVATVSSDFVARFRYTDDSIINLDDIYVQIELGTNVTPYKPHKSTTKELLYKNAEGLYEKPVLRKVSDTIFDSIELHSDGKYYYHKRCNEVVLNGSENWSAKWNELTNTVGFYYDNPLVKTGSVLISNLFCHLKGDSVQTSDIECINGWIAGNKIIIRLNKAKLSTVDTQGFKTWLQSNPTTVVYQLATEEVYECTNIDLNAYDDTTFISLESGFINPEFSAKVSKHIGNVVNQIKEKTDNLEEKVGKLLDERTKGYSSDKGYVVAEDTTDSYIENVRVEGNTLVNLANVKNANIPVSTSSYNSNLNKGLEIGKEYTAICYFNSYTNTVNTDGIGVSFNGGISRIFTISPNAPMVKFVPTSALYTQDKTTIYFPPTQTGASANINLVILEGDHTNNPPSYFEGLLSTGQDVEVMELKYQDVNYLDLSDLRNTDIKDTTGEETTSNTARIATHLIPIIPGEYTYGDNPYVYATYIYDINKNFIRSVSWNAKLVIAEHEKYIRWHGRKTDVSTFTFEELRKSDLGLYRSSVKPYKPYIVKNKQLLYKNSEGEFVPIPALRRINDNVKDTIELHSDGKYYYHKRCGEVVLNGSESSWSLRSEVTFTNTFLFQCYDDTMARISPLCCDKFPTYSNDLWSVDYEGIRVYSTSTYFHFRINKARLSSQDLPEFKTWLSENPVTLVYQLATEEVYECNYLDLNSYEGETLVQIDSGVISPSKLSFTTNSDLPNLVERMKEDVDKNTKFREEMTESVTLTREFENGYEVFEDTREGSVTIDKIEGNTLVNYGGVVNSTFSNYQTILSTKYAMKPLTQYTLMIKNKENHDIKFYRNEFMFSESYKQYTVKGNSYLILTLNTKEIIESNSLIKTPMETPTLFNLEVLVLEGDWTNKELPSYFEGLKSVGDDVDKIEVLSNNLGNVAENATYNKYYYNSPWQNDYTTISKVPSDSVRMTSRIRVYPRQQYYMKAYGGNRCIVNFFRSSEDDLPYNGVKLNNSNVAEGTFTTDSECHYIEVLVGNEVEISKFILNLGDSQNDVPYKRNKKQILYQTKEGSYEKPILRSVGSVSDTIEKHSDGKYYFHKRCGQRAYQSKDETKSDVVTDKTNTVYKLTTEEVYECVNLDLDSYEGETSVIFPSVIPAKIKASVGSNLLATMESMKNRINYLEERVINMFKSVLAGDVQSLAYMLYPEDFSPTVEETTEDTNIIEGIMPLSLEVPVEEEKPKKKTRTRKKTTK